MVRREQKPSAHALVPLSSCYAWGSTELAQYILSGWYQEGAPDSRVDSKMVWHQVQVKQVSKVPEVYEFADPKGGTARLEITR